MDVQGFCVALMVSSAHLLPLQHPLQLLSYDFQAHHVLPKQFPVTISLGHGLRQYDQRTEAAKEAGWRQMNQR